MSRALFLAERGLGRTTPNPIVGAVVVSADGIVVGQGAHLEAGGPHAEIIALEAAGSRARGGTLYCTLEPCAHVGRTGPCVERIVGAGVGHVVIGTRDLNPRVSGAGVTYLRAHGVTVTEDVEHARASAQNAPFFTWVRRHRPFVIAKTAVSSDGFVGRAGQAVKLTGPRADRFLHRQRAAVDAIAVGSGTVLCDDPRLTARGTYRFRPLLRVIIDWSARVPATARVFSTLDHGPVIMVVLASAAQANPADLTTLERAGVLVDRRPDRDLRPVLQWLAARETVSLLVEGGPRLQAAFGAAGLVDRVQYVRTPAVLRDGVRAWDATGGEAPWRRWPPTHRLGEDALIEFDVHRTD